MTSPFRTVATANASCPAPLAPTEPLPVGHVSSGTPTVAAEPAGTNVEPGVMHAARVVSAVTPVLAYEYWRAYSACGDIATAPAEATVMQLPTELVVAQGAASTVPVIAAHVPRDEMSTAIEERAVP